MPSFGCFIGSGARLRSVMAKVPVILACLLFLPACAGEGKREPLVPEETQERSEELYGQQAQTMGSLNQTPAEQAGARHEAATRPVEPEAKAPSHRPDD